MCEIAPYGIVWGVFAFSSCAFSCAFDMATFRLYTRNDQPDNKGHVAIYLRISHKGKRVFLPTSIKLHPRYWNEKTAEARKTHKSHKEINQKLSSILSTCSTTLIEMNRVGDIISADRLKREIQKAIDQTPGSADFIEYGRSFILGYYKEGKISTWRSMRTVLNKLEAYQSPVYFADLTHEFLRRFRTHLREHYGNNVNTTSKNLGKIKTILYAAIREGHFPQERNPFFQFPLETEDAMKVHLKPEEIDAINALNLKEGEGPFLARDYFMFAFYMFGIRFTDVAMFSSSHISKAGDKRRARWVMSKTGRKHSVIITKPAEDILSRYKSREGGFIFPILDGYDLSNPEKERRAIESRNAKVNKDLKKIRQRAGIETHISFHISRHSIAGYLLGKGWGVHDISKALGHTSIKQTEDYFKGFDFGYLDDKMDDLWD